MLLLTPSRQLPNAKARSRMQNGAWNSHRAGFFRYLSTLLNINNLGIKGISTKNHNYVTEYHLAWQGVKVTTRFHTFNPEIELLSQLWAGLCIDVQFCLPISWPFVFFSWRPQSGTVDILEWTGYLAIQSWGTDMSGYQNNEIKIGRQLQVNIFKLTGCRLCLHWKGYNWSITRLDLILTYRTAQHELILASD